MEWVIVGVCVIFLLICAGTAMMTMNAETDETEAEQIRQGGISDAREAHYMANFWSYDGSQQQDWEE